MIPDGVAMPNAAVAWSTSPQVAPASTRTVWSCGLTVVLRSSDRSMTRAPSHTPRPAALLAAPADHDLAAVLAGEAHAGDDVGGIPAAGDGGRVLVDHGVVHSACLVVSGIAGHDQVTAHGSGQFCVRCRGGGRCGHVVPSGCVAEIRCTPKVGTGAFA